MQYWILAINKLVLGCCTTFLCTLIKCCSQLAKITIPSTEPLYTFPSPPTRWTNWPIKKFHVSKLNWRQIFFCQYMYNVYITIFNLNYDSHLLNRIIDSFLRIINNSFNSSLVGPEWHMVRSNQLGIDFMISILLFVKNCL